MIDLENTFFSMLVLFGGIFSLTGMILYIFPPKKINYLYGYRTASSMKSEERWHFAQRYSAIAMLQSGLGLLLLSVIGLYFKFSDKTAVTLAGVLIALAVLLLFLRTEMKLKKFS